VSGWERWEDVPPVSSILEDVHDSLELRINHHCRPPGFSFREGFSNTKDDFERGIQSCLGLVPNQLGSFVEQCTALRVTW